MMNHPDDEGHPTFVPENTRELSVGEEIANGDLKWHQAASRWAEIQKLGYRTVKASQKGLYRRHDTVSAAENEPYPPAPDETSESSPRI